MWVSNQPSLANCVNADRNVSQRCLITLLLVWTALTTSSMGLQCTKLQHEIHAKS